MAITLSAVARLRQGLTSRLVRIPLHPRLGYAAAFWTLFVVGAIVVLATFQDYGVTWDENVQNQYGKMVLNYYLSGFQDRSALSFYDLWAYGGFFDSMAAAANLASPFGEYETRHLLNAAVGMFGVLGCWRLAGLIGGPRAAFWAAAFLLLMPTWYGQMFNNPKDVPFAVFFVWSLYYMVCAIPSLPRVPLALCIKLGLMVGLSLGIRVGGLLLFVYLMLLGAAFLAYRFHETRQLRPVAADLWAGLLHFALPVALIAYPVMLLFWPWAQAAPIEHPLQALQRFSHLPFQIQVLFNGEIFVSSDPPWSYLPVMLLIKLPEHILMLLLGVTAVAAWHLRWQPAGIGRTQALSFGLVAVSILFPIVYVIVSGANLFDGIRHFLFLLPPVAVAAGVGLDRLLVIAARRQAAGLGYAVLGLALILQLTALVRLHPSQYVYYNELVGGVQGASGRFETDYWANSFAEVVTALETELREEYGSAFEHREFKIRVCDSPFSAAYYFPPNFKLTTSDLQADFLVAFTRYGCHKSLKGQEVYRVERMGALLAVAIDRRPLKQRYLARQ